MILEGQRLETEFNLPQMIINRARRYKSKALFQYKDGWSWKPITWVELEKKVKGLAAALMGLGFKKGDKGLILLSSSLESFYVDLAVQFVGGISVLLHEDEPRRGIDIKRIAGDSESRLIFVDAEEKLEEVLGGENKLPNLIKVITTFERHHIKHPKVTSLGKLTRSGFLKIAELEKELILGIDKISGDEVSSIFYKSDLRRKEIIHRDFLYSIRAVSEKIPSAGEEDQILSFLPPSEPVQRFGNYVGLYKGMRIAVTEGTKDFFEDVLEVKPTILFEGRRELEKIYPRIKSEVERNALRRFLLSWIEKNGGKRNLEGWFTKMGLDYLTDKILLSEIRRALGSRVRYILTDVAPSAEIRLPLSHCGIRMLDMPELSTILP